MRKGRISFDSLLGDVTALEASLEFLVRRIEGTWLMSANQRTPDSASPTAVGDPELAAQDPEPQACFQSQQLESIRLHIQAGINRRDENFLRKYFEEKTQGTASLTTELFTSALKELGVRLTEEEIQVLFRTMDVDNNGVLDLDEFKRAVQFPSTTEQLISTLPITQIFSDAVLAITGADHLRQLSQITPEQVEDICNEAIPFLKTVLRNAVEKTAASFKAMDESNANQSASTGVKFEVPSEMSSGSVHDFHLGLTGRVGVRP